MLNQYDSHTTMDFIESTYLPVIIRFIDNKPYIVDGPKSIDNLKGAEVLKINGVDIKQIIASLDSIICYASYDYLKIKLEAYITNANVINSLPVIKKSDHIKITTSKGEVTYDLNNLEDYYGNNLKPNYNLEIRDNTAIITYNSCKEENKMIELINKLRNLTNVDNYVVDLRYNGGGDSAINRHLVDFLKDKKTVVVSDERVFSSARMCFVNLRNNGAKVIGTNPGTPISCFGNNLLKQIDEENNLVLRASTMYWFYDENNKCYGVPKEMWNEAIKQRPDLLATRFINVDERVELTLDDYLNHTDSVLDYAVSSFKNNKTK